MKKNLLIGLSLIISLASCNNTNDTSSSEIKEDTYEKLIDEFLKINSVKEL